MILLSLVPTFAMAADSSANEPLVGRPEVSIDCAGVTLHREHIAARRLDDIIAQCTARAQVDVEMAQVAVTEIDANTRLTLGVAGIMNDTPVYAEGDEIAVGDAARVAAFNQGQGYGYGSFGGSHRFLMSVEENRSMLGRTLPPVTEEPPTPSPPPPATHDEDLRVLDGMVAEQDAQIRALEAERNAYKAAADALSRAAQE